MQNNQRLTTDEFIKRAIAVHGYKYDYSNVVYKCMHKKVVIKCPIHEDFEQTPHSHLRGGGCPLCAKETSASKRTKTKEDFILRAIATHGDRYNYSKMNYKNLSTKIIITCTKHGDFEQTPYSHLQGHGCPKCADEETSKRELETKEDFVRKAIMVHGGDKYLYEKVKYIKSDVKVCITCKTHGDFWQKPNAHLCGSGCPTCFKENRGKSKILPIEDFINKSTIAHNGKYNYSLVTKETYIDTKHCVPIICPQHGVFWQLPKVHKKGCGCPHCPPSVVSIGENVVSQILNKYSVLSIPQYKITNDNLICGNKSFFVDFYLPLYNTIIEYNGQQHYEQTGYFGGKEKLEKTQDRDLSLRFYCKEHGIRLIEIPYTELKNIESLLTKELNLVKNL